jgi:AraC family transcriptional activator of pobA
MKTYANPTLSEHHLFAATSRELSDGLDIRPLSEIRGAGANKLLRSNWLERYHIVYIRKVMDDQPIEVNGHVLKSHTIYCVSPRQIQVFKLINRLEGYSISFAPEFIGTLPNSFNSLFQNGLFTNDCHPSVIELSEDYRYQLDFTVSAMHREYQSISTLKYDMLKEYLKILLMYLTRHKKILHESNLHLNKSEIINKFFLLLQKNFISKKLVADYADLLAVSPNYLNNIVKKATGYPVSYHIQQYVIQEAKRQAIYTNKSMKEIAYDLGFEAITHFSKFFKKNEGCNFSCFRKKSNVGFCV